MKRNKASHITAGNVFEDLGFSAEEAAVLRIKTEMHIEILKIVEKEKLTPTQLGQRLDIPQPRVSELLRGKISSMTADRLVKYLHRLGRDIRLTSRKTA